MARKDAILNLRQVLIKRRDALRKALAGDLSTASVYLELSLSLNGEDENAQSNYDVISASLLAQN